MKKHFSLVSAFLLAGASMAGLAACSGSQSPAATTPCTVARGDSCRLPVAYVNVDTLVANYELWKDLDEDRKRAEEDARMKFNGEAAKLEKEVNDFQRKLQTNAFLSEERAQQEANRLQKRKAEIEQLGAKLEQDLTLQQVRMNARISDSIHNFLREYNAIKGYEMIFSNVSYSNIIIDFPRYDITAEVLQQLNARYNKEGK